MIVKEAQRHGVPERLVRRVVMRESRYNPRARNHSFWGLMQISYPTAKSMGFKGTPQDLLNPVVNLTYAVPYLANAFVIAGKHEDAAIRLYAHGYYDAARHRGLLGDLRTADSVPAPGFHEDPPVIAGAEAPSTGFFGSLFGAVEAPPPTFVAAAATNPAVPPNQVAAAASAPATESASSAQVAPGAGSAESAPGLPKKWLRDGGVTVLARGEQAVDKVAANAGAKGGSARRVAARHTRKVTDFASLDTPASAQAYAAPGGDSSAVAPQAAIAQAIAPAEGASAQPGEAAVQADSAADDRSTSTKRTAAADKGGSKRHKALKTKALAQAQPQSAVGPVAALRP